MSRLVSSNDRFADQVGQSSWAAREASLRRKVGRLEAHIRNLESEKAELVVSASDATKPLPRCAGAAMFFFCLTKSKRSPFLPDQIKEKPISA